jgi:hypothetical protein
MFAGLAGDPAYPRLIPEQPRAQDVHDSTIKPSKTASGAGGARTHDRRIMRSTARRTARTTYTDYEDFDQYHGLRILGRE